MYNLVKRERDLAYADRDRLRGLLREARDLLPRLQAGTSMASIRQSDICRSIDAALGAASQPSPVQEPKQ